MVVLCGNWWIFIKANQNSKRENSNCHYVLQKHNGNLNFHFSDSELVLFNHHDTIQLLNTTGDYDIIDNLFSGIYAESDFLNDNTNDCSFI